MPLSPAQTVQPPSPPSPPSAPSSPDVVQGVPTAPIAPEQAAFLRTRGEALSSQLRSVQRRRDDVAEKLRDEETRAEERPGLQERLNVLDQRLLDIEKEIAANSAALANAGVSTRTESTAPPPGADRGIRFNGNAITVFSFLLLMPFAFQLSRRLFSPNRGPSRRELAEMAAMRERMDKMEGAIDAVAIEVERIGEGQRFLTQAMMGGNLPAGAPAFEGVKVPVRDEAELR